MSRVVWRLGLVLVITLLAGCGSEDKDSSQAKVELITSLSAGQLVGQWMDGGGNIIEFFRDGSISGYSDGDFEAATYTLATNGDGEIMLLLNTTNGSVYAREFELTRISSCDGHAFAFLMAGAEERRVLWYVGGEQFEPVSTSELRAHPWNLSGIFDASLTFEDGGRLVLQSVQQEDDGGTWVLDGNNLSVAASNGSYEQNMSMIRVARCQGRPLVIAFHSDADDAPIYLIDLDIIRILHYNF